MAGANVDKIRQAEDFHATPEAATVSLCRYYKDLLNQYSTIWEPASGLDDMVRPLERETGAHVIATDLFIRDLFKWNDTFDFTKDPTDIVETPIITNPPFKHAEAFIRRSHELRSPFVAMLLKVQFWNASSRLKLWEDHPPKANHPFSWRLDFSGQGRPTMDCMFVVWGDDVPFSNEPLRKPICL